MWQAVILCFCLLVTVFLFSLLIAQLSQAYQAGYRDMQGYARLNRVATTVTEMESMSSKRWTKFLESLCFDEKLEFNEGDVGVAGGVQARLSHQKLLKKRLRHPKNPWKASKT